MEKPILSPNFTIEDIHKLREYHYYLTKDMAPQKRQNYLFMLSSLQTFCNILDALGYGLVIEKKAII